MMEFIPISEKVEIAGHEFTVAALPMGVVRRYIMPLAERFANGSFEGELLEALLKYTHMSVSLAEPDITLENLENSLMISDVVELFAEVMRVSGLTRKAAKMGEAQGPLAQTNFGESYTGISQQEQDGLTAISTVS